MRFLLTTAVMVLEMVTVINAQAPYLRTNETTPIVSALPRPHSSTTTVSSLPSTTSAPQSATLEPIKAGVSYVDTTSIVSIFYTPTGSMTTLMVAPGEPTAEAIPGAGSRTSPDFTALAMPTLTRSPTQASTPLPTQSINVAADSGVSSSYKRSRSLFWGFLLASSLWYGTFVV